MYPMNLMVFPNLTAALDFDLEDGSWSGPCSLHEHSGLSELEPVCTVATLVM